MEFAIIHDNFKNSKMKKTNRRGFFKQMGLIGGALLAKKALPDPDVDIANFESGYPARSKNAKITTLDWSTLSSQRVFSIREIRELNDQ